MGVATTKGKITKVLMEEHSSEHVATTALNILYTVSSYSINIPTHATASIINH